MKTCKHIIEQGIENIGATGNVCGYCADERIEEVRCSRVDCPSLQNFGRDHWHPEDAEQILNA